MAPRAVRCILVLGACVPGVASAATVVVDPSGAAGVGTVAEALAIAADGDTLQLAPGDYPPLLIADRVLTIAGSAGARLASVEVQGGAVTLSAVELSGSGVALTLHNTTFSGSDLDFSGGAVPRTAPALRVAGGTTARFSGVDVHDWLADGGVVVLDPDSTTTFTSSTFSRNRSSDGGAVRVDGGSVVLDDCHFTDNSAAAWGGDIAASGGSVVIHASTFTGSSASYGGAIAIGGGSTLLLEDGEYHSTQASRSGGFLYVEDASATVARVVGVDAQAEVGGALALFRASLHGEDLTLVRSRAGLGGHLHGAESTTTLTRTHMTAGFAERGAAVAWSSGDLDVDNALWASQEGAESGGALYVSGGQVHLSQATLADNRAELGSAIAMDGGRVEVDSSIVFRSHGDSLVVAGTGQLFLTDTILNGTDGSDYTGDITAANSVSSLDPQFTADAWGDYTLQATSPALDAMAGAGDLDGTANDLGAFGGPDSWPLPDADGDGYVLGRDCNDDDAAINEGSADAWYDGIDSNCDRADDFDQDRDGAPALTFGGDDCNDSDPTVHPGASESSGDGIDSDCDGLADRDADGDGWTDGLDCDDADGDVHPMAPDAWYDGVDSDCGGNDDFDADRDGSSAEQGDCDDSDDRVGPDAVEVADDGVDQDCDGSDLEIADADQLDSDSEVAAAGTDADSPDPERILTKTGCSTAPGDGSVPASFLAICGLLFFRRRRH